MDIFKSKKFQALIAGIIITITADYGLELDQQTIYAIVGLFAAYMTGQGIADVGKEKAKIEAQNGSN
jgi:uncharacterized membrane protein (DUF441 family)